MVLFAEESRDGSLLSMANRRRVHSGSVSTSASTPVVPLVGDDRVKQLSKKVKGGDVLVVAAIFLFKVAALEGVRRASQYLRCPGIWRGIQALQFLCYPPLKWLKRWVPLQGFIDGIQMFSRPLLLLSVANAVSNQSDINTSLEERSMSSQSSTDSSSEPPSVVPSSEGSYNENGEDEPLETWLVQLYEELHRQQIPLPARLDGVMFIFMQT